ncbi:hypothetical protein [Duganella sp. Leaf61]|uniref:hypothetical protein n=1 Tax=Duganella sp. Leaf61 TaxID=1736227 RepID=UPI000A509067|nr:hypothetical protein [Duganella sp. Leaf61]
MNRLRSMVAIAIVAASSGCATYGPADQRHGYIDKVYAEGERPAKLPDCLAALDAGQLAGTRFVAVQYGTMRLRKHTIALAPAGMRLAERDKVAFVPAECLGDEAPRIIRLAAG